MLERAISLVGADYSALGVLDRKGGRISLAAFKAAPHATTDTVQGLIASHEQSLDLSEFPAAMAVLAEGKTLRLLDKDLPFPFRLIFNATLGGRAALVAPVRVAGHTFGLLGLVWSEAREGFADHEVALVEGIADQIGTALERDQLSAEVMHLRSACLRKARAHHRGLSPPFVIDGVALSVANTQTTVLIRGFRNRKALRSDSLQSPRDHPYVNYLRRDSGNTFGVGLFGHEKGASRCRSGPAG